MNDIPLPLRIGIYTVLRWLGQGAYGNTYLVENAEGGRFALKWLREDAEAGGRDRFENEKVAMKRVDHSAFPKFIDSGAQDERPFIVMTFGEGDTIRKRIDENAKDQTYFGGLKVLLITQKLLEGLRYLYSIPLAHRDIKDDNALVSASGDAVMILDLGQCKGDFLPVQDKTFWHIGASRYCPPSKIEDPSSFEPSHDVFAVGVTCYRMLTNIYPWEVSEKKSIGHLKNQMLNQPPPNIRDINTTVDNRIIDIVMKMIEIKDYKRIDINDAIKEIDALSLALSTEVAPEYKQDRIVKFPRVFRDNLHGDIQLTDLERRVINTREFQRLRYIKQLGTTHLVFHGAEHSRFSHVIGTMHVVEKILRSIELREGRTFEPEERWAARLYGLVHDIAHAPFGHTLEDELGFFLRHDKNDPRLQRLFGADDAELSDILQAVPHGRSILDLLHGNLGDSPVGWIASLIEGPAGADVIDYIDRDALHCGLDHRVDSAIYRWFTIDRVSTSGTRGREIVPQLYGSHGSRLDADHAVISILAERYALFLKVYTHPAKVAAGAMLGKALSMAIDADPELFSEAEIERWDDATLITMLLTHGPLPAQKIMNHYIRRQLYRPSFQSHILPLGSLNDEDYRDRQSHLGGLGLLEPTGRMRVEKELAEEAGVPNEDVIIYASRKAPGATSVRQRVLQSRDRVSTRDRIHKDHRDIFKRHLRLWQIYLLCGPDLPDNKRNLLASIVSRRWDMENQVEQDRRQMAFELE